MTIYNREDSRTVLPQIEKIIEKLSKATRQKATLGSTSGTLKLIDCYKDGNIVSITFTAENSSAVNGGANLAEGTVRPFIPAVTSYGCGYSAGRAFVCMFTASGRIVVRNASAEQHPANSAVWLSITYIVGDK